MYACEDRCDMFEEAREKKNPGEGENTRGKECDKKFDAEGSKARREAEM